MRHMLAGAVLAMSLGACAAREARDGWNDSLKVELLDRLVQDQRVRDRFIAVIQAGDTPDSALIAEFAATDSSNTAWLSEMVERHGWPDRDVIGEEGAKAAFLLVQHADQDTAFQVRMLDSVRASFERGQADGQSVALLTDRILVARGDSQRYGTQARMEDGRTIFNPIEDSSNVDARRKEMGLVPLADYRRVLDSVYLGKRVP